MMQLGNWIKRGRHALAVMFFALACTGSGTALSSDTLLPDNPDELVDAIRHAIEQSDYQKLEQLVFWKDAGKIKKRIVRFQLNRNLGRPIKSIAFEDFPEGGLDAIETAGNLEANMDVTNRVRVIFDEEPINDQGKLPTTVFVVGKREGVYRVALVVRKGTDDDGD